MNLTPGLIQLNSEAAPDLYHSYLLRIWRTHPNGAVRVVLQSIQTGENISFATMESLFAFLLAQNTTAQRDLEKKALQ